MFLLFAIVQLFGIELTRPVLLGVSLQAMGLRLKRYQAVVLDSILACALTIWAEFQSTFSLYMKEFVGVIIVWIAPWFAILIVDWLMRKYRYSASELQRRDAGGLYFKGKSGVNWNGIIAFFVGLVCATLCFSKAPPPVNFPLHWMTPISNHYGGACAGRPGARQLYRWLVRRCGPSRSRRASSLAGLLYLHPRISNRQRQASKLPSSKNSNLRSK